MVKKIKEIIPLIVVLFVIVFAIFGAIRYDIYRWHTAEKVFHTKMTYWQYHMLFNKGGNRK